MRTLLSFALAFIPLMGLAQAPLLRNYVTTNQFMNPPQDGWIAIWNNVAQKWSNGVNTASATNDAQPPSTVLSNLTATGVSPGATNASAYIASLSGLGSNTHIKALIGTSRALLVNTNTLVVTNGNVGVGTDAPSSKLQVVGDITTTSGDITAHTGSSFRDDNFAGEFVLVTSIGPTANIEESAVTLQQLTDLAAAGPARTNFVTASFGSSHHTNGVYIGASGSSGLLRVWDNLAGAFRNALIMGGATYLWGTNSTVHQFLGTSVSPNVDDTTSLGQSSLRWKGAYIKDFLELNGSAFVSTNLNTDSLTVSNNAFVSGNLTVGGVSILNALDVASILSSTSTNLIVGQSEDASPAAGDFILAVDVSTASLTKIQLGSLPSSGVSTENSPALQIDTGVLSLTPGVLSNIVQSGHGAPYIAVNTNGGSLANITNLVFRTPNVVVSNDSAGIASVHVASTGGSGSTNNPVQAIGTTILTNGTIYKPLDLGSSTNITLSWNTNYYVYSPSNNFGISLSDTPPTTDARQIFLKLINTNATSGVFPTNGLNGGPVIMLPASSTNEYTFNYDTNGFWIRSGQILSTGTGDTNVFNINPTLHGVTNNMETVVGNTVYAYSTSDFVATNSTANSNLTVNFADGTREIYLTNNISLTNYTGMQVGRNASVKWRVIPLLVNRTVVWPPVGNGFSIRFGTNSGSTLWTTFTNGTEYWLSWDSWNTNIVATVTAFSFQ